MLVRAYQIYRYDVIKAGIKTFSEGISGLRYTPPYTKNARASSPRIWALAYKTDFKVTYFLRKGKSRETQKNCLSSLGKVRAGELGGES